jgi:hypothetical protein
VSAHHHDKETHLGCDPADSEQRSDPQGRAATRVAQLVAELSRNRDLVWLVERVSRADLEERDPAGWEKVSAWLAVQGITIVRI